VAIGECEDPDDVDHHLSVSGNNVVFGIAPDSWTLVNDKLCHGTKYLEVSGRSLVLGDSGHAVIKE
jgi:hypothetical protein